MTGTLMSGYEFMRERMVFETRLSGAVQSDGRAETGGSSRCSGERDAADDAGSAEHRSPRDRAESPGACAPGRLDY